MNFTALKTRANNDGIASQGSRSWTPSEVPLPLGLPKPLREDEVGEAAAMPREEDRLPVRAPAPHAEAGRDSPHVARRASVERKEPHGTLS
jgi:hypothetical protein